MKTRRQAGLTMIEVMFALSILAVAFLALFGSMTSSSKLATYSNEDLQALQFAQDKVEELKAALNGAASSSAFVQAYQNTNYSVPANNDIPAPASTFANDLIQSCSEAVYSYTGAGAIVTTPGGPPNPDYVVPAGTYSPVSPSIHTQHGQIGWATPE